MLFAAVLVGLTTAEHSAERQNARALRQRFSDRAPAAAGFLESYASYVLTREARSRSSDSPLGP